MANNSNSLKFTGSNSLSDDLLLKCNYRKGHQFQSKGSYHITVSAEDWACTGVGKEADILVYEPGKPGVYATMMDGQGNNTEEHAIIKIWGQGVGGGSFTPGRSGYPMAYNPSVSLGVAFYTGKYIPSASVTLTNAEGKWGFVPPNYDGGPTGGVSVTVSALRGETVLWTGSCSQSFETDGTEYKVGDWVNVKKTGNNSINVDAALRNLGVDPETLTGTQILRCAQNDK
ncbi:MAG: hypothetical protein ACYC5N_09660 [Endomicrobiales bacterium]